MKIELTEDQQLIHNDIIKNITNILCNPKKYSYDERMFSIEGAAGMGKSVLTASLVKSLSEYHIIRVSTPTHKSLNVINNMLKHKKIKSSSVSTIHSYLKLTPKENFENGTLVLETIPNTKIEKIDILIIDEASMIGKSLYKFIDNALKRDFIKCIIWVSDKHQLDPVLDEINPMYTKNIKSYKLTKIIRQIENNPIIKLSTKIRKCIEHNIYPSNEIIVNEILNSACEEIEVYTSESEFMNRYFNTKYNFYDNLLVSYTNKYINYLNKKIRNELIKSDEPYTAGEYLIFNGAHIKNNIIEHNNSETIKIKKATKNYSSEYNIVYWDIIDTKDKWFKAVDLDWWDEFDKELYKLSSAALSTTDKKSKKELWQRYFELKNEYQKVSYVYACTIHKSQGSSVNEIFINLREILNIRNSIKDIEFLKLLYVAITRPKYNAIFLI